MICMGGDGLIGWHTSFFLGQGGKEWNGELWECQQTS